MLDDSGYDVVLCPDHLGLWPPFTPLVVAAEVSDRLRFATQVLNIEFWNPALLAREAAAVDILTDGRLELGFGAGHAEEEFRAAGLDYPPPRERVDHLAEAVPLVRRLLAGETVSSGGHYPLDSSTTGLHTVQDRVPIMVGGNGDRVLELAALTADIVGLVGFTAGTGQHATSLTHFGWDGLANRVAHVRHLAAERVDELELSLLVQAVFVTDNRAATAERIAGAFHETPDFILDSPFVLIGTDIEVADQLRRLRSDHGVTYITVFDSYAADFAKAIRLIN
jgi:probable F420-dependent oxidoreductase